MKRYAQHLLNNLRVIGLSLAVLLQSACTVLPPAVMAELRVPAAGEPDAFAAARALAREASDASLSPQTFRGTTIHGADGTPLASLAALPPKPVRLITSGGANADDALILLFEQRFHVHNHIALLVPDATENGGFAVLEASSVLQAQGADLANSAANSLALVGSVKRRSLEAFMSDKTSAAVYDLPAGLSAERVLTFAQNHVQARTAYDGLYDAADATRLYCSEFVARALMAGGADALTPQGLFSRHPSIAVLLNALGIRAERLFSVKDLVSDSVQGTSAGTAQFTPPGSAQLTPGSAQLLAKERLPVATILRDRSAAEAALEQAALALVWRKFSDAQRVGELFELTPAGLEFRGPVARFMRQARALARSPASSPALSPALSPAAAVQALADRMFLSPTSATSK
jgi:hypothetical protein